MTTRQPGSLASPPPTHVNAPAAEGKQVQARPGCRKRNGAPKRPATNCSFLSLYALERRLRAISAAPPAMQPTPASARIHALKPVRANTTLRTKKTRPPTARLVKKTLRGAAVGTNTCLTVVVPAVPPPPPLML